MSVDTVKGVYGELLATAILVPFGKMAELMLLVRVEELFEEDHGEEHSVFLSAKQILTYSASLGYQ